MPAVLLSACLLIYFWIVGYAVVSLLHTQRDLIRNFLIAPSAGVTVTLYSIYVLSRLGLPVGKFCWPLTLTLLASAVALIAWRRPVSAGRQLGPFVGIALVAFVASGWPLVTNGFYWLGNANPDFTNYVLNAQRLLTSGYFDAPNPKTWAYQTDWSAYWATYPAEGVRSGSELLLAWTMGLSGRNGLEIYMPLIIAFQVALVCAVPALIATPHRRARILTGVVAATSAMLTLGLALQLIAQILGMLCTSLACVLCLSPFYRLVWKRLVAFVAFAAIVMAALLLSYPEMLPLVGLPLVVYHALGAREVILFWQKATLAGAAIGFAVLALSAPDAWGLIDFLFSQLGSANTVNGLPDLFPNFLIPSGLAALWGFSEYVPVESRILKLGILLGFLMTTFTVLSAVWLTWRRDPPAVVLIVMVGLAATLFFHDSGFAMLKLSMYAQPFLIATFVSSLARLSGSIA